MRQTVQHLRGTSSQWEAYSNFVPKEGEIVVELDEVGTSHKLKIGDGIHSYDELSYVQGGSVDEEWVKEYVEENSGAIVYLNTKQYIGDTLELQDVYPIQASDNLCDFQSANQVH
jgi:hypothetical protein